MKRTTFLKVFSLIILAALIVSCAPAATPPAAPVDTEPSVVSTATPVQKSESEEPTSLPEPTQESNKVYKATWYQGCPWVSVPLPDPKDDVVHQYILENYNLDINVTFNAECDDAKTTAMIAAGDIPDFMQQYWTAGSPTLVQLIDQDVVLPIDLDKYPGMKNAIPAEGYNYLKRNDQIWGIAPPGDPHHYTLWVRQDWLDKLQLKAPTTPDEVLAVAKAFTTQDPDGNGKNDTYGLTSFVGSNGQPYGGITSFLAPFGFIPGTTQLAVKDNQAFFPGLSDGAKQGLMWLNEAINQKVIDPAWSVNTEDQFRQMIASDKVGMVAYYLYMLNPNFYEIADALKQNNSPADWVWMDPLTGPAGQYMNVQPLANGIGNAFFVTTQAQSEPGKYEAIMKFLNDAIDPESDLYRMMVFGIQDETYWTDDSGLVNKVDYGETYKYMRNYRLFRTGNEEYRRGSWQISYPLMVEGFSRADDLPVFRTVRGLVPAADGQADLDTYVAEMHVMFATGEEDFDDWDDFVNEAMTTYRGQEILAQATESLQALGLIK